MQNIPFNVGFVNNASLRLGIGYTEPDEPFRYIWTASDDFETYKTTQIGLAWTTYSNSNDSLEMWFNGKKVFDRSGLNLWTDATYPKFGIYRGERGNNDIGNSADVYDLWIYRAQISNISMSDVGRASGVSDP